ncbi:MAG TPA: ANTAR domain-containing protein [Pseudonocardiaceae bacterium]|nr:ANTAR domain-containing protein [Pseudonocardiaceae bacterium]
MRQLAHAVVCEVSGELDLVAVPQARERLLSAVSDVRPPKAVVLDLAGLTVLSAAAAHVLLDVAERCESRGVYVCAVLAPGRPARQVTELISAMPVFETVVSALERITAQRPDGEPPRPVGTTERGEQFLELAQSMLAATTVAEVLDRVVVAAAEMLPTADLASITLRDRTSTLHTPVRSDPLADRLDELQYRFHEGPCYDAALPTGPGSAACADLAAPTAPWPKFAPVAAELGMAAVMSTALLASVDSHESTGALNVYSRSPHGLDDLDHDVMLLLASHASLAVSHTRAVDYAALRETQLRRALDTRDVIGQAKGIIMARRGVDADEAFQILRRASQDLNVKLVELAETLASHHTELDG